MAHFLYPSQGARRFVEPAPPSAADRFCELLEWLIALSQELSRWLFVWLTFPGANVALKEHANLGTDLLVSRLPCGGNIALTFRVFPGDGVHSDELMRPVSVLGRLGYRGDYSVEVINDDYQQLPLPREAERARSAAVWLAGDVMRRHVPLPGALRPRGA